MENFLNRSAFQWKFLALNLENSQILITFKRKFGNFLIFLIHIVNILIYGFVRSYLRFTEEREIGDLISGCQVIIFSGIMLVKYILIFINMPEISKIIKILPQKLTTNEKIKFNVKELTREGLKIFYIYAAFLGFFSIIYIIKMQINLNFKMVGGLWCPPGSDLIKRIYYIWILILNLSVLHLWIYSEILKYGLIAVTIIEYRKIAQNFKKIILKFRKKLKKKKKSKKKKVRFLKTVDFGNKKVKLKASNSNGSLTSDASKSSNSSINSKLANITSKFHVAVPIHSPFFLICGKEDVFGAELG
ncbi:hypothetical protein ACKWTF_014267 [Chironomus riparius]